MFTPYTDRKDQNIQPLLADSLDSIASPTPRTPLPRTKSYRATVEDDVESHELQPLRHCRVYTANSFSPALSNVTEEVDTFNGSFKNTDAPMSITLTPVGAPEYPASPPPIPTRSTRRPTSGVLISHLPSIPNPEPAANLVDKTKLSKTKITTSPSSSSPAERKVPYTLSSKTTHQLTLLFNPITALAPYDCSSSSDDDTDSSDDEDHCNSNSHSSFPSLSVHAYRLHLLADLGRQEESLNPPSPHIVRKPLGAGLFGDLRTETQKEGMWMEGQAYGGNTVRKGRVKRMFGRWGTRKGLGEVFWPTMVLARVMVVVWWVGVSVAVGLTVRDRISLGR